MLRYFSLVIGIACILMFIPPLVMYRILNLGNATGLVIGFVLIIYGIFADVINKCIYKIWSVTIGRTVLCLCLVIVSAFILVAIIISVLIFKAASHVPTGDETLVVLGCQVKGQRPSLMLTERLTAAEAFLNENENSVCILSGGKGADEQISEALCMYNYLVDQGISPDRLFMEDRSTSTRENLLYSYDIIKKNGLNENVAIVTNEFHEYRAFKIADKLGIKPYAVPAHTHWWLFSTYFVREWYGVIYEWTGMTK